jgi:hypothetical protein
VVPVSPPAGSAWRKAWHHTQRSELRDSLGNFVVLLRPFPAAGMAQRDFLGPQGKRALYAHSHARRLPYTYTGVVDADGFTKGGVVGRQIRFAGDALRLFSSQTLADMLHRIRAP